MAKFLFFYASYSSESSRPQKEPDQRTTTPKRSSSKTVPYPVAPAYNYNMGLSHRGKCYMVVLHRTAEN